VKIKGQKLTHSDKAKDRASREKIATQRINATKGKDQTKAAEKENKRIEKVRETSRKAVSRIQDLSRLVPTYSSMKDDEGNSPTPKQVEARLISEGYTAREIDVAKDLIRNKGRLSARGVAAAHELNIRVPSKWRPKAMTLKRPPLAKGPGKQKRPT
jgi:hypothetical protein